MAIVTGIGGLVTAIGGVLLAIRAVRDRERKAAKREVDDLSSMLTDERHLRLIAERHVYDLSLRLAERGIDPDDDTPPAAPTVH